MQHGPASTPACWRPLGAGRSRRAGGPTLRAETAGGCAGSGRECGREWAGLAAHCSSSSSDAPRATTSRSVALLLVAPARRPPPSCAPALGRRRPTRKGGPAAGGGGTAGGGGFGGARVRVEAAPRRSCPPPGAGGRPLPPRCGASGCRPSGPGVRSAVLRGREGPGAPLCGGGTRAGFGGLGAPAGASGARTAGLPRSRRLRLHDDGCARSRTCDDAPWRSRAARRCGFCGERRDAASGALAAGALVSAHVLPGGPSPCVTAERPARPSFAGGFC